jgi:uncharacterized repeat protein (TIGR04002 family)
MKNTKTLVLTALFAALIFVATYSIKMPLPLGQGYVHFGDAFIYMAACILPFPYAMLAASIGGALSDTLAGYAQYIFPTLIIKALLVIPFTYKTEKLVNVRNILAPFFAGLIGLLGYFIAETFMYGAPTALTNATIGSIQPIGSLVIFYILAITFDKLSLKNKLMK